MASVVYLDTHVVVLLYAGLVDKLSGPARRVIGASDLLVSPMVHLELDFLYEIGRTSKPAATVMADLNKRLALDVCGLPFRDVVVAAAYHRWTRDPFDRMIVGHAEVASAGLVTKDEDIRKHYPRTIW